MKTFDTGEPLIILESCPPRRIHELLSPKWTSMTLYVLHFGTFRTGELQRAMPGVSKKMLSQTLRELEADGLIDRTVHEVVPPMVEYSLTDLGREFTKPLMALYDWSNCNSSLLDQIAENRRIHASKTGNSADEH